MRRGLIHKMRQASPRTWAATAAVLVVLALAQPTQARWLLGLPLVLVGEAIRVWGTGYLVKTDRLILSGPYAYIQHPLYAGTMFILPGLLIMCGLPWWGVLAGLAVFFGYYMRRKHRRESERLRQFYGEQYTAYEASVPLLVPYKGPYRGAGSAEVPWSLERVRQNSEDGTVIGLVLVAIYLYAKAAWI